MGWSAGYDMEWQNGEERPEPVSLGDFSTFPEAIRALHTYCLNEVNDDTEEYETLIADIDDIRNDPGIMGDPDMWEDEEFFSDNRTFWIVSD